MYQLEQWFGDDKVCGWCAKTPRSLGVQKIKPGLCVERTAG